MTESTADGRLFELYRTYIGEPDEEIDVYLGFALFFGAVALGLASFAGGAYAQWADLGNYLGREIAFALGMSALPTALVSLIVLLPVDRRGTYGGVLGVAVCLAGIGFFTVAYPQNWSEGAGPHYSVHVLLVYGLGLATLLASTGAALVTYHIDRMAPTPGDFEREAEDEDSFSDEEIRRDIDQAMADVDLTWGGVEPDEGTPLTIRTDDADIDTSGMDVNVDRVRSDGVGDSVAGLKAVKGGERERTTSQSTVDDETSRLRELRARRREESAEEDDAVLGDLLVRITGFVRGS